MTARKYKALKLVEKGISKAEVTQKCQVPKYMLPLELKV